MSQLLATLQSGDYIGFTFFVSSMAMLAASVFFLVERGRVKEKWKISLLVSALITLIAGVHYYYMRGQWVDLGESPTEYRYIDWTLTVPLMCVEFFLLLRPAGVSKAFMWRMIIAAVWMLVFGYIGEGVDPDGTILWGAVSTLGWAVIVYEIFAGEGKKVADKTDNPLVVTAFKQLRLFVLIGWAIYPIGYMAMEGNLLAGVLNPSDMDLIYNIGDAANKIGFGLVVYGMAIQDSAKD